MRLSSTSGGQGGARRPDRAASLVKAPWLALTNRKRFMSRYHRLLWLFRPYSVSCVLVRKPV